MTSRERIRTIMNFGVPDRVGMFDWYWPSAVERWHGEGLAEGVNLIEHFGFDMETVGFAQGFGLEHEVLEEDDETVLERNRFGMTQRQWKGSKQGAPHQVDTLIKTRDDWARYRERFGASLERFWDDDVAARTRELHEQDYWANFWYLEPFELTWRFFGFKETLMLMASDPAFAAELFEAGVEQIIGTYEAAVAAGAEFDGNFVGGDIAGKNGPLFSPRMYRELLMPHHRRLFRYFNERGVPTLYHGDGDNRPILDLLLEAGVVALHPLEVKAGMDLRDLKARWGDRLVLFGGIDVRALSGTREDIDAEIRGKLPVAMEGGGYIYCVDHSVAPTVSLANYEYALALIREVGVY